MNKQEKLTKDVLNDTDKIIDGIIKIPYSRQIKDFGDSVDKLEESKEILNSNNKR